jgi:UrcA family protein
MSPLFSLATVLSLVAGTAFAQSPQVQQRYSLDGQHIVARTEIPYADLDLATPAGLDALTRRLDAAADAVCSGPQPAGDSYHREAYLLCRDTAIRSALARLPAPARTRLAAERSHGGAAATGW